MKNILVIGNGFDVAHGLNTRYTDFLNFCNFIKEENDSIIKALYTDDKYKAMRQTALSELEKNMKLGKYKMQRSVARKFINYLKSNKNTIYEKKDFVVECRDNYWIKYVNKNKDTMGEKWCDFEYVIGHHIEVMSSITKIRHVEELREYVNHKDYKEMQYFEKIFFRNDRIYTYEDVKNQINIMFDGLKKLTWILEVYLDKFLNEKRTPLRLFELLPVDYILSFNYIDTYQKVYKKNIEYYHNIHGVADTNRDLKENNMVFGIGQNIKGLNEEIEDEYVYFQKYYQRIIKKTGNLYKTWLKSDEIIRVFIYGHSLDVPDGDVITDLVEYKKSIIYIFYYNQQAFNDIVINLVKIFGKDCLIDYTGREKINFISCNDLDRVKEIINEKNEDEEALVIIN